MIADVTVEPFMRAALDEAHLALSHDDVPVGAVVVMNGEIISRRHNERELANDPTAHAEVLAIRDATAALGSWRLSEADLYVTLEPCIMCAGALVSSRMKSVVFGATDPKAGATGSLYNVCVDPRLNHEVNVKGGVMSDECADLLRTFFASKRRT